MADIRKPWHVFGRDFMISVTSLAYPITREEENDVMLDSKHEYS